jgi:hypothetical protein
MQVLGGGIHDDAGVALTIESLDEYGTILIKLGVAIEEDLAQKARRES